MAGKASRASDQRSFANRHVGGLVTKAIAAPARRRGFTEAVILNDWDQVVGAGLARRCQPVRVSYRPGHKYGALLELKASGGAALEIQHAAPQIIERINQFFGRRVVNQLRIVQAPVAVIPRPEPPPAPRSLQQEEIAWIDKELEGIEHQQLRISLASLGAAIRRSRPAG